MYVCPICTEDPTSHSFKKIESGVFYTKPADATRYWDTEGICAHYDGVLGEVDTAWTWIFDGDGLGLKHVLEIDVGIALAKLISTKHSHNLETIHIINPSWYSRLILRLVLPFLSKKMQQTIVIH